jgi:ubiquinone/menaquinone biosynthesis C-methylase UbiE/uncharacterized protein YbaR (Trm112 family)
MMRQSPQRTEGRPVLDEVLACPACRGRVSRTADGYACQGCARIYPVIDGVPTFVDQGVAQHDEIDHHGGADDHSEPADVDRHKTSQSAYFDRLALTEFEIERPAGTPAWYQFLLTEKLRRSLEPFNGRLDGWTALTVCGGSGMDAEFLAGAGATVISSDLSIGAAHRVEERARRHRVAIIPTVADVEHLPFADRSIDLVYVHDGLHHLEDPLAGLAEMARVARRAVCITEPAEAAATGVAVRLGLALEREEAGNRVARLRLADVQELLEAAELRVLHAERYLMYYKHVPGRWTKLVSRRPAFDALVMGWRVVNRFAGRLGNKLVVVAARNQPAEAGA